MRDKLVERVIELYNKGLSYNKISQKINKEFLTDFNRAWVGHLIANVREQAPSKLTRQKDEKASKASKSFGDGEKSLKKQWSRLATQTLINLYNTKAVTYQDIADELNVKFPVNEYRKEYTASLVRGKLQSLKKVSPEELHRTKRSTSAKKEHTPEGSLDAQGQEHEYGYINENGEAELTHVKRDAKGDKEHLETTLEILNQAQAKDDKFILKAFGYDPKKWRIIRNRSNFYQMQGKEGKPVTLWQVKIDVEPLGEAMSMDDLLDIVDNHPIKPLLLQPIRIKKSDRNLVLAFADLHFGITSYGMIEDMVKEFADILSTKNYKKIRIEQLGDLFHSDSFTEIKTARGTLLTTDGQGISMEQAVQDALHFYEVIIDTCLQNTKDVEIYHTQGNHSPSLEYMFLVALEAKYPSIKIHKNIKYRTAYKLDNVGIMLAHGDTAKNKLPMIFANEYCNIWGNTVYRELHTGHYHFEQVKDDNGVVWRQLGTPKPSDGYEMKNGYTMAHKKLQILEYDPDNLKVIYNLG